MLDKELSKIINFITDGFNKNSFQINTKEILLEKRKRTNNESEYFHSLCSNVAYFFETNKGIKTVLQYCLTKNEFLDVKEAEAFIADYQETIKKEMSSHVINYKELLAKDTLVESIHNAEFNYMYSKLENEIMIDFVFAFLHPENKSLMEQFLNYNSSKFMDKFESINDTYIKMYIS